MVKDGRLEQPLALLFMWGYYLTMEGCTIHWATKATDRYIKDMKYKVVLGDNCSGERAMQVHGWHRVGTKMAVNSFQTQLRKQQKKVWGIMFKGAMKLDKVKHKDINSDLEIVDIGKFLPQQVKNDMSRVNETRFMVRTFHGKVKDLDARLKMKVESLFKWADEQGVDRGDVTNAVIEGEEGVTFDQPVPTATVVNDDCTIDHVGDAVIVNANANVPTMAPTKMQEVEEQEQRTSAPKTVAG